jgi:nucleoside-diphosphate-sugar epimerase
MRVVITGSGGYIGSNLMERLKRLPRDGAGVELIPLESRDGGTPMEKLHDIPLGPEDIIIHCAAHSNIAEEADYERLVYTNLSLTLLACRIVRNHGCRLLFFSSSCVHQKDEIGGYTLSKLLGEEMVKDIVPAHRWAIIRPTNVVGGMTTHTVDHLRNGHLLPRLYEASRTKVPFQLFGPLAHVKARDFVHVRRVCELVGQLVVFPTYRGPFYEAASGVHTTIGRVVALWQSMVDPTLEVTVAGSRRSDPHLITEAIRGFEWKMPSDLMEAMQQYALLLSEEVP